MAQYNNRLISNKTNKENYSPISFTKNLQNSQSCWQFQCSNVDSRIDAIRKKYQSPYKSSLKTQSVCNSQLRQSNFTNQSRTITKETFVNDSMDSKKIRNSYKLHSKEEQEEVFQKIKEMKASIMNEKTTKSFFVDRTNNNNSYQKQKCSQNFDKSKRYDSRADNIDKINLKIKNILNCLDIQKQLNMKRSQYVHTLKKNQCDQESLQKKEQFNKLSQNAIFLKNNIKQWDNQPRIQKIQNKHYLDEPKFSQKYQRSLEQKKDITPKFNKNDSNVFKIQKQVQQSTKQIKVIKKLTKLYEQPKILNRQFSSKSQSFMPVYRKQIGYSKEKSERHAKNFDEEINKIQNKIKQFQQEKKKLNIQYKPFEYHRSSRSSLQPKHLISSTNHKNSQQKDERYTRLQKERSVSSFQRIQTEKSSQITRKIDQNINKKIGQRTLNEFNVKLNEKNLKNSGCSIENLQLKKKLDEGIEQRKKRLTKMNNIVIKNIKTKQLINLLCNQIQLDQSLRNAKLWFHDKPQQSKWSQLKQEFKLFNNDFSEEQIKMQFCNSDEQNNPFFSVRESQDNFSTLACKYTQAQKFWNTKIYKQFLRHDFEEENMQLEKFDLQKKGFIILEDFVRFMNIQTGQFFRNRDLILIFKRLTNENKLHFNDLLAALCRDS